MPSNSIAFAISSCFASTHFGAVLLSSVSKPLGPWSATSCPAPSFRGRYIQSPSSISAAFTRRVGTENSAINIIKSITRRIFSSFGIHRNFTETLCPPLENIFFKQGCRKLWHVRPDNNRTTYAGKLTHLTIKLDKLLMNKFRSLWKALETSEPDSTTNEKDKMSKSRNGFVDYF